MIAGDDSQAIEQLSRYKAPGDFLKAHNELRTKLSQRAEPMQRPGPDATPEQLGEWRKSIGLPEMQEGAAPDAYLEAYGIKAPDGYEMSQVEQQMMADYAAKAYEAGWSPAEVSGAAQFFFEQQQSQRSAMDQLAIERQREWQTQMREDMGPREYDAQIDAATRYLKDRFEEDSEALIEIRTAQLPGGGMLGDHPAFIKMVAELAMQHGYTDQIQANAMESSGGKSLKAQHEELQQMQFKDPAAYQEVSKPGGKLDKIIELRMKRGEIDEFGNERKRA